MPATITINANAETVNEAFGITNARASELIQSIVAVQDGFKTVLDAIQYDKTISANNQEFVFLMYIMNPGV